MKTYYDAVIVGGGFKGMMTAYGLIRQGQRVCIIDNGRQLGGFMSPMPWRGINVDKGPQYLDGISESQKRILDDIMDGHEPLAVLDYSYGSFWNGRYTEGYAIPDYRSLPLNECALLLYEALNASPPPDDATSIADLYGEDSQYTYHFIRNWCNKFLQNDAGNLSPLNRNFVTFFGRKLLLDDDISLELKQHPRLDAILAARKSGIDHCTYNLYPLGKNLGVFREAFEAWLHRNGADTRLGHSVDSIQPCSQGYSIKLADEHIEAGAVYCAATIESSEQMLLGSARIREYVQPVAQLFYLLEIDLQRELPFYIMNYDDSSIARVTHFSAYANTSASDKSVICVEVPTTLGSALWNDPEQHFPTLCQELEAMHITPAISAHQALRVPSTYRAVLSGYEAQWRSLETLLLERFGENLHLLTPHLLTRASIMSDLETRGILA